MPCERHLSKHILNSLKNNALTQGMCMGSVGEGKHASLITVHTACIHMKLWQDKGKSPKVNTDKHTE